MIYTDKWNKELISGDIINLHQTVNGQGIFVVLNVEPLDVRYGYDLIRVYEYDVNDLFNNYFKNDTETEIVGNIYDDLMNY